MDSEMELGERSCWPQSKGWDPDHSQLHQERILMERCLLVHALQVVGGFRELGDV